MRLEGKFAIITGTAGGMGQASAILFAKEGAKIACVDLSEEANAETMAQIACINGPKWKRPAWPPQT